eukprot:Hpha_TRINITY_DN15201_c0_g3::TRINITY_DN15201_c0_g3_i2::g.66083::m.66083
MPRDFRRLSPGAGSTPSSHIYSSFGGFQGGPETQHRRASRHVVRGYHYNYPEVGVVRANGGARRRSQAPSSLPCPLLVPPNPDELAHEAPAVKARLAQEDALMHKEDDQWAKPQLRTAAVKNWDPSVCRPALGILG